MEDKVLTESDIHWIVRILEKSSTIMANKDKVSGALGLTLAESDEITSRVRMEGSGNYKHFSLVMSKWIEKNSDRATLSKLAMILRHEEFTSTADELLRMVESSPKTNTANDDTENGATTTTAKKFDELKIPKSSMNEVQNISTTGKDKPPQQSAEKQMKPPPIPLNLKTKEFGIDEDFKAMNLDSGQTQSYGAKLPNPSPISQIKTTMPPIPPPLPTSPPNAANSLRANENQLNITGEDQIVKRIGNGPFQSQNSSPNETLENQEIVHRKPTESLEDFIPVKDTNPITSTSKVDSKPGQTEGKSSQIEMTKLKVSGKVGMSGFWNWLRKDESVLRSQVEFNQFLKSAPEKFSALKSIQFNDIEMNWGVFWDSVDRIKTMESIVLINIKILRFIPARTILLPNMKKYVLELDWNSSYDIRSALEQARKNSAEVKYLVEYLIPFAKDNLGEDVWSTCLSLKYVRLDLDISFRKDKDNFEFQVDRIFVELRQGSNSTRNSILPQFLQSFQLLKKLWLTNWRGIVGYIDFSSFPSSLTHFRLYDSVTSIRDGDLEVVLKMCRELVYLHVGARKFSNDKHTIDIANLSPEIRYLSLDNTSITCSSPCEFNNLSVLYLNGSHFHSSVNVPFIFRNVKKCYFEGTSRSSDPPFTGLKNWLEMGSLEFIGIWGLRIDKDDEVRGILTSYGVPANANRFTLERNVKKQWKFVTGESQKNAFDVFNQLTNQTWNYTVK